MMMMMMTMMMMMMTMMIMMIMMVVVVEVSMTPAVLNFFRIVMVAHVKVHSFSIYLREPYCINVQRHKLLAVDNGDFSAVLIF